MRPRVVSLSLAACLAVPVLSSGDGDAAAEITITAHKSELLFDVKEFTVKPGQVVKLTLVNPADSVNLQPHNLVVIEPGTMEDVGMAANSELADPAFLSERHAVPRSNYVLHHTRLLQPGETETIEFVAPEFEDDYPFLCTYPGHWSVMHGVMVVEE